MRIREDQRGFAAFELVLVVVLLAALAAAGWWVHNRQVTAHSQTHTTAATSNSSQPSTASNVASAPPINSASDLDSALNTLNQNDPSAANSSDNSQLSSQSNF